MGPTEGEWNLQRPTAFNAPTFYNYTQKKDSIQSKKMICLNEFLRIKEMICLNEIKFV